MAQDKPVKIDVQAKEFQDWTNELNATLAHSDETGSFHIDPQSVFYLLPDKVVHRDISPEQKLDLIVAGRCHFETDRVLELNHSTGQLSLCHSKYPTAARRPVEESECVFPHGPTLAGKFFRVDMHNPILRHYQGKDLSWKDPIHVEAGKLLPDKIKGHNLILQDKIKLFNEVDGIDFSPYLSLSLNFIFGYLHCTDSSGPTPQKSIIREQECTFLGKDRKQVRQRTATPSKQPDKRKHKGREL